MQFLHFVILKRIGEMFVEYLLQLRCVCMSFAFFLWWFLLQFEKIIMRLIQNIFWQYWRNWIAWTSNMMVICHCHGEEIGSVLFSINVDEKAKIYNFSEGQQNYKERIIKRLYNLQSSPRETILIIQLMI